MAKMTWQERGRAKVKELWNRRNYYLERKNNGLCVDCGAKASPGLTRCEYHRDKRVKQSAKRRAMKNNPTMRWLDNHPGVPRPTPRIPFRPVYGGLLESPAPPPEKPIYTFNRRDRMTQLDHLREAG